jgi:hypothetical protein
MGSTTGNGEEIGWDMDADDRSGGTRTGPWMVAISDSVDFFCTAGIASLSLSVMRLSRTATRCSTEFGRGKLFSPFSVSLINSSSMYC